MQSSLKSYGWVLLFFLLLAGLAFRCGFGEDKVFTGSDANIGILAVNHRHLPERFLGGFGPSPLLGNAGKMTPKVSNIGKTFLKPEVFSNVWYAFYLILSSIALVAYLRLWNMNWLAAVFGATSAFWVGSITLASSGHLYKLGVMAFFMVSLYLLERSLRAMSAKSAFAFAASSGVSVGLMLLEQEDVGLLAGIFLGLYGLVRMIQLHRLAWKRWLLVFAPIALIGAGLAGPAALKSYDRNVTKANLQADPQAKWNFVTQWSMVPGEVPDLVAPGYTGWKTGHPDGPYWGKVGQSAEWETTRQGFRNFRLDSLYIGVIPIFFAVVGASLAVKRRREPDGYVFIWWGIFALVALWLSFGKYSPLYKVFYELPLVGNIRAPIKFLHNFQVFIGLLAAYGIHGLMVTEASDKRLKGLAAAGGGVALAGLVLALGIRFPDAGSRFAEWGDQAALIVKNISHAWLHAGVMGGVVALCAYFLLRKRKWSASLAISMLIGAVVFDTLLLTSKYFEAIDVSDIRKGNAVINYLKQRQGNDRIFFDRNNPVYNSWLGMDVPFHGLHTVNIWQMPRMPADYKEFLQTVGPNQMRFWQLTSVKYLCLPASVVQQVMADPRLTDSFEPVMYYRFGMRGERLVTQTIPAPEYAQDQALLLFKPHVPRFALFTNWDVLPLEQHCERLADPAFDPLKTVIIEKEVDATPGKDGFIAEDADVTIRDAVVNTSAEAAGILLFTQRLQAGWSVTVDGEPAELLRCNYLCMGVEVPAGQHEIRFKYN